MNSVGQANFDWIVNEVAELAVDKAKQHTGKVAEYRWSAFLAGSGGGPSRTRSQANRHWSAKHCRQGVTPMNRPSLSIGIEEEYQTIDPETRDLRSHIAVGNTAQGEAGAR